MVLNLSFYHIYHIYKILEKVLQTVTHREIKKKDLPDYSTFTWMIDIWVKGNSKLWFDSNVMEVIILREKFKEIFLRTKFHVDHERFKEQHNVVQQKMKNKKSTPKKHQKV